MVVRDDRLFLGQGLPGPMCTRLPLRAMTAEVSGLWSSSA